MNIRHKNSGEIYDVYTPVYCKLLGMYGFLTMTIKRDILFFYLNDFEDMTNQFEIVK